MSTTIECKDLSKSYGSKKVLDDITLSLKPGRITGLLGKNGEGKSTLIKCINGLLVPEHGEVLVDGHKPGIESKKHISYLPERSCLDTEMTVNDVIAYYKDFYEDFDEAKARELLKNFGLDAGMRLKKMSKGMQEKVQLILVMSRQADFYILDEPLGGVDPASRDYILDTILSNFKEDAGILISTHLISDVERILDDVIFLDHGKVVLQSDADTLRSEQGGSIDEIFRREFACLPNE